jgi:hypothetical protein
VEVREIRLFLFFQIFQRMAVMIDDRAAAGVPLGSSGRDRISQKELR